MADNAKGAVQEAEKLRVSLAPTQMHAEYIVFERHVLQDNIILCDTKAGILLAFAALIALRCLDKIHVFLRSSSNPQLLVPGTLYVFALLSVLLTVYFAWKAIRPRIRQVQDYIFWGASTFKKSRSTFATEVEGLEDNILAESMLQYLHTLASICGEKFNHFRHAVITAEFSAVLFIVAELTQLFFT